MRRPSIKTSLLTIFTLILSIIGGVGYFAINGLSTTNNSTVDIATNWLPSVAVSDTIATSIAELGVAYRDHVIAQTDAEMVMREADIATAEVALRKSIEDYYPLIASDAERTLIDAIKAGSEKYIAASAELLKLSRANKTAEAGTYMAGTMTTVGKDVTLSVDKLVELNVKGSADAASRSASAFETAKLLLWSAIGIAVALVGASIIFVMSSVASSIARITAAMKALAAGDTATAVPFSGRADEIGTMAAAVEVFRQAALDNKRMEAEAETARKQAELDRVAAQERAEADAAERLRIATSGLAAGLKRLAAGDLAFQLTEAFAPDFESLRHDFNQSVSQLGTALSTIASSITTMDGGTREISAGAMDLSKRTEQQAAALEETAAALDEITANVNSAAKRTEEARTVATQANAGAVKSAEVVSNAVGAMQRIEESSQQISNIIGVIDEIAFQTNLLALNAGVEAARAGEAGKGFAVVAQEVRELAQRSAQAAKEIKALIHNSSQEVVGGVKLVRDAGEALKSIGSFISQINVHMDAISTSAKEQSIGLAEVNSAVNQLDQTTQQNAAMVEQSTAASSSLEIEAGKLRELVGQFQLRGGSASQPDMLRQTARAMAQPVRAAAPASAPMPRRAVGGAATAAAAQESWEEF